MATFLDDRDRARLMDRLASGELLVPDAGKKAFQTFPLKHLILYALPFPKGAPTAPLLLAASPEKFEEAVRQLNKALDDFLHEEQRPAPPHPLFGPLTRKQWGALMHKHIDHHLRQFGA